MRLSSKLITLAIVGALLGAVPLRGESDDEALNELLKEAESSSAPSNATSIPTVEELPEAAEASPPKPTETNVKTDESELSELEQETNAEEETTKAPLEAAEPKSAAALPPTAKKEPVLSKVPVEKSKPVPAQPFAESPAEKTVVCCKTMQRFPKWGEALISYDLKRKADCVDNSTQKSEIEIKAQFCREPLQCCFLPNLGHVYGLNCRPDEVMDSNEKCEQRRMKKRMRICCVTVQEDDWIAVEGWIQRKRCHDRDGQILNLPEELCRNLRTADR